MATYVLIDSGGGSGDGGWVQTTNFIVTGLLAIGCAAGMRLLLHDSREGTLGPLLIGTFGLSMIMAGVFPADPALGFHRARQMG